MYRTTRRRTLSPRWSTAPHRRRSFRRRRPCCTDRRTRCSRWAIRRHRIRLHTSRRSYRTIRRCTADLDSRSASCRYWIPRYRCLCCIDRQARCSRSVSRRRKRRRHMSPRSYKTVRRHRRRRPPPAVLHRHRCPRCTHRYYTDRRNRCNPSPIHPHSLQPYTFHRLYKTDHRYKSPLRWRSARRRNRSIRCIHLRCTGRPHRCSRWGCHCRTSPTSKSHPSCRTARHRRLTLRWPAALHMLRLSRCKRRCCTGRPRRCNRSRIHRRTHSGGTRLADAAELTVITRQPFVLPTGSGSHAISGISLQIPVVTLIVRRRSSR